MTRARGLLVADVVVVLALAGSALWQVWSWPDGAVEGGRGVHTALVIACTLPLLLRRQQAVAVFLLVTAAGALQYALGGELGQPFFAVVLALYSIGAHASSPLTYLGPAVLSLQVAAIDLPRLLQGDPVDEVVPAWFVLAGVWAFGRWMRRRRVESDALAERVDVAEREATEKAARAVTDERARIARELHDLVAHSMGVIVVQAQGAQRALNSEPDQARAALTAIESTGRKGMAEMRRLLGLLTAPAGEDESRGDAATAPQPGLAQLGDLVAGVRAAGLPVRLQIDGDVRALAPGLELSAFRLVQEALTNTLKHAGPASASIRVHYRSDCLEVEVADDGAGGKAGASSGHGLVGMRERVALYGGSLQAGPENGSGFVVRARMPLNGERS